MKKLFLSITVTAKLCLVVLFTFHFSLIHAQVAINPSGTPSNASAILDLQAGNAGINKGFLPNAVALTATNFANPVLLPATGLIVYNTVTAGSTPNNVVPGYYYWTGTAWLGLGGAASGSGINNYLARWTPNGNILGTGLIRDNDTSVGINGAPSNAMLYVNSTRAAGDSAIGITYGVYGFSANQTGVYGQGDNNAGVVGFSSANIGVFGNGGLYGVQGFSINSTGVDGNSANNTGVSGEGKTFGGSFTASAGQGVYSTSSKAAGDSSIGVTYGVYGQGDTGIKGNSVNGVGVYGSSSYIGVYGSSVSFGGVGIYGITEGEFSTSVAGVADGSNSDGVYGESDGSNGIGVYGESDGSNSIGVFGVSDGSNGIGAEFEGVSYAIIVPPSGGNVGIGTNTPTTLLQLGDASTTSGKLSVFSQDYVNGQIQIGNPSSDGEASMDFVSGISSFGGTVVSVNGNNNIWNIGSENFGLGIGKFSIANKGLGGPVMTFVSSVFVGVGCTSPAYTLDVAENIRASGSVLYGGTACTTTGVTAYSKPDYVFESDYKKSFTTDEVANYIAANGHLPWVTSAIDEKKENNGAVDITRMSFQTLEAVENTQNQIIEQQKTIVSQQTEIETLKKQLTTLANSVNQLLNKQK